MNILLTTHLFLPEYSAGTEILTFETARELQRRGHSVSVFTGFQGDRDRSDAERFDHYVHEGIEVERFHQADVPMGGQWNVQEMEYNNRFCAEHFRGYLRRFKPDIVHSFHLARLSGALVDVCREEGVPQVFTPTDFWFVCPLYQLRLPGNALCSGPDRHRVNCIRHLDFIDRPDEQTMVKSLPDWAIVLAVRLACWGGLPKRRYHFIHAVQERPGFLMKRLNCMAKVLAPTRLMADILVRNGLRPELVTHCPFGLNLDYLPATIERQPSVTLRIGFIGSLFEHKGIHVLLEAARSLGGQDNFVLKVYGENREEPAFVERLHRLAVGDERIDFCGTFPNRMVGVVLAGLDVVVVPSVWYENTPLVIYSAQAAGCPVIASNLGGMAEVVHHEINGLLVEPGDAVGLAAALKRLIDDRALLARLSQGTERPKSIQQYVQECLEVYRGVAGMPSHA